MLKRSLRYKRKTYRKKAYRKKRYFKKRYFKKSSEMSAVNRKIHVVRAIQYSTSAGIESGTWAIIPFGCAYDQAEVNNVGFALDAEFLVMLARYQYWKLRGIKVEILPQRNYQTNSQSVTDDWDAPWNYMMDKTALPLKTKTVAEILRNDNYRCIDAGRKIKQYFNVQKMMKGRKAGEGQDYSGWLKNTITYPSSGAMYKSFPQGKGNTAITAYVHITAYVSFKEFVPS